MKPSFLSIVDKQRLAEHRLNRDKTTRSDPEIAHYRRVLESVPLDDVTLPRLPLVRNGTRQFVLLGEIAQLPGIVLLFDLDSQSVRIGRSDQLGLTPPDDRLTELAQADNLTDSEMMIASRDGRHTTAGTGGQATRSRDPDQLV